MLGAAAMSAVQQLLVPDETAISASTVVEMLRRHYLPEGRTPGGIFAAEIESPDGRRRADAIWAPWSIAGDRGLIGHEVKVSRSDVLAELADPMKAEPWARYCSRWWLVVASPALVAGLSVPEAWGIMAPPSGRRTRSMTVLREAPLLKAADTGPGWRRIAAWEHYRHVQVLHDLTWRAESDKRRAEHLAEQLANRQDASAGRESPHAVQIGRILRLLDEARWDAGPIDPEAVAGALIDLGKVRRLADSAIQDLEYTISEARRVAEPAKHIASELEKLAKAGRPAKAPA